MGLCLDSKQATECMYLSRLFIFFETELRFPEKKKKKK